MKVVALAPFEIHSTHFGGAQRIFELLSRVENKVIVLAPTGANAEDVKVGNLDIRYKQIPDSLRMTKEFDTDLAAMAKELWADELSALKPDVVILEHPWQVEAITDQKFVYDAHNNEADLKRQIHPEVADKAAVYEAKALKANLVTYCSDSDNIETDSPKVLIPNGTHLPELGEQADSDILLFVGSAHIPNVAAALMLTALATNLPEYKVIIAGACGLYIQNPPPNVKIMGHVTDQTLDLLFRNSHAFINLITAGSGTSLKIARALSYGLPVISSKIGARGYEDDCIIAPDGKSVLEALRVLEDPNTYAELRQAARAAAEPLSWDVIGKRFSDAVLSVA